MSELGVFIDESGDFGPYKTHAPLYIITLVFHEQTRVDISKQIEHLKTRLVEQGLSENHAVHSAPLIRKEGDYVTFNLVQRRKIFKVLFDFMRLSDISYKSFIFHKKELPNHDALVSRISRNIGHFLRENLDYLMSFDKIIVYSDNGQKEITNLVNTLFNAYLEAEVRKVSPSDYSLFQAADMFCTLALLEEKLSSNSLSKSESTFFEKESKLRKNYLKPARVKLFKSSQQFRRF
ncbi:DUF3800 domain-containing protein [Alloscardovia venturai]|uniref:DUF3800 domain-containing protein n=1 Tax=Alloscardovia venturai TaxID=1769421 RepID=A0ABW2Y1V2_9BIFI